MDIALAAGVLFVFPLSMLIMFRSNAGIMFLAACGGLVLLDNIDGVVITTAGSVVPSEGEAYIRLSVVLLSIVFSALVFRDTVQGGIMALHVLILAILATTLWLLLPEVTGVSWLVRSSQELNWWQIASDFRALLITAGIILSLIAILTTHSIHRKHRKAR